ncbi:MAG: biopolymer transporter ExbD [bacterium]
MKFKKRSKVSTEIPNSSLSDIAFLLLIFFMVSTVFAIEEGLILDLPSKEAVAKKISRKNIMRVSGYADGTVTIDDEVVNLHDVRGRVEQAMMENDKLIVVVETDPNATYGLMIDMLDELKLAQAQRVSLKTLEK